MFDQLILIGIPEQLISFDIFTIYLNIHTQYPFSKMPFYLLNPCSRKFYFPFCVLLVSFVFYSCSKSGSQPIGSNYPAPKIDSISPTHGSVGTIITISGQYFRNSINGNTITLNGVNATVVAANEYQLKVMVPVTTSGKITVETSSGKVDGPLFTYARSPIVAVTEYKALMGGYSIAAYWVNGVLHKLTPGTSNADAYGLAILGTNLFIVGHEYLGGYRIAKIWKNGIAKDLALPTGSSDATCIVTSQNDIYVGGFVTKNNKKVATVWKNDVEYSITDGTNDAQINSIAVSGDDVYVCGYENNGSKDIAKFWKNGVATVLSDGRYNAIATGITVAGKDVLVVGNDIRESYGYNTSGYVWKNAVQSSSLTFFNTNNTTYANSIITSGTDMLIAGHYYKEGSGITTGCAWTNKNISFAHSQASDVLSMVVDSGNVYAAGVGEASNSVHVAKLWINGEETILTDLDKGGVAHAVIVR